MQAAKQQIEVLFQGMSLDDLNGYPGTRVWSYVSWNWVGVFNSEGMFVAFMDTLH